MSLKEILINHNYANIINFDLNSDNVVVFDFTEQNTDLLKIDLSDIKEFTNYIFSVLKKNNTPVGLGGYNENRSIYKRSKLFSGEGELRTIHLGIDIWAEDGTEVFAPINGKVHSFQNNSSYGDYGPTIILEHKIDEIKFYTLYGHLSLESLEGLYKDKFFSKGDKLGYLGNSEINVHWPPHLHFQVITDMLGKEGDFPGVAPLSKREYYLNICPDPNLILKIKKLM